MKVLDLQCGQGHPFEGWFASEDDFVAQKERALVHCPLCGDAQVLKKLSAPRLNLSRNRIPQAQETSSARPGAAMAHQSENQLAALLEVSRKLVANTVDVGDRFAEEARKIHYGEAPEQAIRGEATANEAQELLDEGIAVIPLLLPASTKQRLQ